MDTTLAGETATKCMKKKENVKEDVRELRLNERMNE
jgi:hypothetical protein